MSPIVGPMAHESALQMESIGSAVFAQLVVVSNTQTVLQLQHL